MLDDLTITRLCAEAMGFGFSGWVAEQWRPLVDKAQAMELVEKFHLWIIPSSRPSFKGYFVATPSTWLVEQLHFADSDYAIADLLRAICLCVAKMQLAKEKRDAAA